MKSNILGNILGGLCFWNAYDDKYSDDRPYVNHKVFLYFYKKIYYNIYIKLKRR